MQVLDQLLFVNGHHKRGAKSDPADEHVSSQTHRHFFALNGGDA